MENTKIYKRVQKLAELLNECTWQKDGKNSFQKYKYITEQQYKFYHGQAVQQAGLVFKFEILESNITDLGGGKLLTQIKVNIKYIDPDTGEEINYTTFGQGIDNGDKGIYKAETGAYKYHIACNFHINENADPENDSKSTPTKKVSAFSTTSQSEAKKTIISTGDTVSPENLAKLNDLLVKYKESKPDGYKKFVSKNKNLKAIKNEKAISFINQLSEVLK